MAVHIEHTVHYTTKELKIGTMQWTVPASAATPAAAFFLYLLCKLVDNLSRAMAMSSVN